MEYSYPKVLAFRFENFRSLSDITVDLQKAPIVALTGRNEIGKSSVSYGIRLLGTNLEPRTHKEFIKTGMSEWRVSVAFSDGSIITRTKSKDGQSFHLYQQVDGKMQLTYRADKLDDNDVPQAIQKYLGFCIEPETKEVLNVRLYKNLMLFVDTASSTNYKVMNNALRIETLYGAVKQGNTETNTNKRKLDEITNSISTCQAELRKIHLVEVEPLTVIKASLQQQLRSCQVVEQVREIEQTLAEDSRKGAIAVELRQYANLDDHLIDVANAARETINELGEISKKSQAYQQVRDMKLIDLHEIEVCEAIEGLKGQLEELQAQNSKLNSLSQLKAASDAEINTLRLGEEIRHLQAQINEGKETEVYQDIQKNLQPVNERALELFSQINDLMKQSSEVQTKYTEAKKRADEWHQKLHESGAMVGTCPRCGETVVLTNVE